MLEPNFHNLTEQQQKSILHRYPQLKTSYGGGFRKYEQSGKQQANQSQLNYKQDNQILGYVRQLGIENLPQLYARTIPDQSGLLLEKQRQQQQQSVVRLYKNLYNSRKKTNEDLNQQQKKQNKKYAEDVWELDKKYNEKQPQNYIIVKELEKIHKKYKVQLQGILKRKKIQLNINFEDIFAYFLIQEQKSILKATSQEGIHKDQQMEVFYIWKRFIFTLNFKNVHKKYENSKISKQILQKLCFSSKYLFSLIKIPEKKIKEDKNIQQKPQKQPNQFKTNELKQMITKQLKLNVAQLNKNFKIHKQYSNPYYIQNAQHKQKSKPNILNKIKSEQSDQQQLAYQFKAKPIPKSTYVPPKQKPKQEPKPITLKPFNLTQKNEVISAEQYYQFQKMREFKAQPVPSTLYKPFKPQLLSQQQKKARAVLSLQKAQYPSTMQNLKNYKHSKKAKHQELQIKFTKNHQKPTINQIPNFDHLHAKQVVALESRKQQNKKQIKVQPFKLSITNSKPIPQQNNYFQGPQIHPYSPSRSLNKPLKSTKKFEAYVNFRAQNEKNNMIKIQKQKLEAQKNKKQKQPYRQTIKARMAQQLQNQGRKTHQYDKSMPKRIKVNKQKIYQEKPLLMAGGKIYQQRQYILPWEPIF